MVGAGIVGTAIAARLAVAGLDVVVLDRFGPAAGTSSSGEGNLLVSDKLPGPELALALRGLELWDELGAQAGARIEFEKKGGLVVAHDEAALRELCSLATAQRAQGASVDMVGGDALQDLEPALSPELQGGVAYAQDAQVQPMLAVAFQVSELVKHGGRVIRDVDVIRAERDTNEVISALLTSAGKIDVGEWVVNAAGPWAGDLARRLGADIPVIPRRGHVLVTEPLPPLVRRKVFEADYVGSVHQSDAQWACSSVIEATAGGTMLLGSSRESVGFAPRGQPRDRRHHCSTGRCARPPARARPPHAGLRRLSAGHAGPPAGDRPRPNGRAPPARHRSRGRRGRPGPGHGRTGAEHRARPGARSGPGSVRSWPVPARASAAGMGTASTTGARRERATPREPVPA